MKRRTFLAGSVSFSLVANGAPIAAKQKHIASGALLNALVIGISYTRAEQRFYLRNTLSDAKAIFSFLAQSPERKVVLLENSDVQELRSAVDRYLDGLSSNDVALIYYAGHAVQVGGVNYILSDDATALVPIADIVIAARKRAKMVLLFLDACRNNPFAEETKGEPASRSIQLASATQSDVGSKEPGLASGTITAISLDSPALVSANGLAQFRLQGRGVKVVFATDPGNVALDRLGASTNSPFTLALVKQLGERKSLDEVLADVTKEVVERTKGAQTPWAQGSLEETIFISGKPTRYNTGDDQMPLP